MRFAAVLLTFLITFFSILSFIPHSALASCVPPVSIANYVEQADIVVLGRVTRVLDTSAIVTVERYFKSQGGPLQIEVTGQESSGFVTSVDFTFEEDKKYLLFLQNQSSNILKTNACMGNREVQDALSAEDLAELGTGESPTGNNQELSAFETDEAVRSISNRNVIAVVGVLLLFGAVAVSWKKWKKLNAK